MNKNEAFKSDYLKTDDVSGMGEVYTMQNVTMVEFVDPKTREKESKPVLWFKGGAKGLVLNKTNWDRIAKAYGDETDNWKDQTITLRLEEVEAFGKQTDAIRVKID